MPADLAPPATPLECADWSPGRELAVRRALESDACALDRFLLRSHFQRRERLALHIREGLLRCLTTAYEVSRDVRFYNELLWFGRDSGTVRAATEMFEKNIDGRGVHWSPLRDTNEAPPDPTPVEASNPLKVALLGAPHHLSGLKRRLEGLGHEPVIFFFPDEYRGVRRLILGSRLLNPVIRRLLRVPKATMMRSDKALDPLTDAGVHVAMHRLGRIIKSDVIGASGMGILNDHLALLPAVRGRSSIEYSLLLGLPPAATIHWIDTGVDTGPIVATWRYPADRLGVRAVTELKQHIVSRSNDRYTTAISLVAAGVAVNAQNPLGQGRRFYTMHPQLLAHVEQNFAALIAPDSSLLPKAG